MQANAVGRFEHLVGGPRKVNKEAAKKREADVLSLVCRTLQAYPEAYEAVREAMRQAMGNAAGAAVAAAATAVAPTGDAGGAAAADEGQDGMKRKKGRSGT